MNAVCLLWLTSDLFGVYSCSSPIWLWGCDPDSSVSLIKNKHLGGLVAKAQLKVREEDTAWNEEEKPGGSWRGGDNNHMQPAAFNACQLTLWTPRGVSCGEFYFAVSSLKIPPGFYFNREYFNMWPKYPKPPAHNGI